LKNADNKAAQRILEKWDIDWYKGKENLVWAPNEGHTEIYRKVVRKMLEDADALGRAKVIDTLKDLARKFTNERTDWEALARSLNLIP
jgi:hypothetical protein